MKKSMMGLFFLTLLASSAANAIVDGLSFSEQLELQKQQLRPQEFNFFSDRYVQIKAQQTASLESFKQQLDSQKKALRPHKFNPVSDAYYQTHSKVN